MKAAEKVVDFVTALLGRNAPASEAGERGTRAQPGAFQTFLAEASEPAVRGVAGQKPANDGQMGEASQDAKLGQDDLRAGAATSGSVAGELTGELGGQLAETGDRARGGAFVPSRAAELGTAPSTAFRAPAGASSPLGSPAPVQGSNAFGPVAQTQGSNVSGSAAQTQASTLLGAQAQGETAPGAAVQGGASMPATARSPAEAGAVAQRAVERNPELLAGRTAAAHELAARTSWDDLVQPRSAPLLDAGRAARQASLAGSPSLTAGAGAATTRARSQEGAAPSGEPARAGALDGAQTAAAARGVSKEEPALGAPAVEATAEPTLASLQAVLGLVADAIARIVAPAKQGPAPSAESAANSGVSASTAAAPQLAKGAQGAAFAGSAAAIPGALDDFGDARARFAGQLSGMQTAAVQTATAAAPTLEQAGEPAAPNGAQMPFAGTSSGARGGYPAASLREAVFASDGQVSTDVSAVASGQPAANRGLVGPHSRPTAQVAGDASPLAPSAAPHTEGSTYGQPSAGVNGAAGQAGVAPSSMVATRDPARERSDVDARAGVQGRNDAVLTSSRSFEAAASDRAAANAGAARSRNGDATPQQPGLAGAAGPGISGASASAEAMGSSSAATPAAPPSALAGVTEAAGAAQPGSAASSAEVLAGPARVASASSAQPSASRAGAVQPGSAGRSGPAPEFGAPSPLAGARGGANAQPGSGDAQRTSANEQPGRGDAQRTSANAQPGPGDAQRANAQLGGAVFGSPNQRSGAQPGAAAPGASTAAPWSSSAQAPSSAATTTAGTSAGATTPAASSAKPATPRASAQGANAAVAGEAQRVRAANPGAVEFAPEREERADGSFARADVEEAATFPGREHAAAAPAPSEATTLGQRPANAARPDVAASADAANVSDVPLQAPNALAAPAQPMPQAPLPAAQAPMLAALAGAEPSRGRDMRAADASAEPMVRIHGFTPGALGHALSAYGGRGHEGAEHGSFSRAKRDEEHDERTLDQGAPAQDGFVQTYGEVGALQVQPVAREAPPAEIAARQPAVPMQAPVNELPELDLPARLPPTQAEGASISLHHPDLGPIQLEVHRERGRVEVHAVIESAHAEAVLRANESGIRQGVQQSGMTLSALRLRMRSDEPQGARPAQVRGRTARARTQAK